MAEKNNLTEFTIQPFHVMTRLFRKKGDNKFPALRNHSGLQIIQDTENKDYFLVNDARILTWILPYFINKVFYSAFRITEDEMQEIVNRENLVLRGHFINAQEDNQLRAGGWNTSAGALGGVLVLGGMIPIIASGVLKPLDGIFPQGAMAIQNKIIMILSMLVCLNLGISLAAVIKKIKISNELNKWEIKRNEKLKIKGDILQKNKVVYIKYILFIITYLLFLGFLPFYDNPSGSDVQFSQIVGFSFLMGILSTYAFWYGPGYVGNRRRGSNRPIPKAKVIIQTISKEEISNGE